MIRATPAEFRSWVLYKVESHLKRHTHTRWPQGSPSNRALTSGHSPTGSRCNLQERARLSVETLIEFLLDHGHLRILDPTGRMPGKVGSFGKSPFCPPPSQVEAGI